MDHSDEKEAKRTALPQQEQTYTTASAGQPSQQYWGQERAYGIPQQPTAGQELPAAYLPHQIPYQPPQHHHQHPMAGAATTATYGSSTSDAAASMTSYSRQPHPHVQHPSQELLYQQQYRGYPPPPHQQQQPLFYHQPGSYPGGAVVASAIGPPGAAAAAAVGTAVHAVPYAQLPPHHPHAVPPPVVPTMQPFIQRKMGRVQNERPLIKLSVSLIDTYKHINTVYYEEREARRAARAKEKGKGQGTTNNGWDDENYDYIVTHNEMFYGRYKIKERIGKGSFGQVVRAEDTETNREVAIKIIKSKKPFLMQAKTEIELLTHLADKDPEDQHNIVRLLTHFMYRNHQCLVFEMLSLNLYELLKNTQFGGVSLNLIRKFAKQVLKALSFLARNDVDIIHCDLKPENILLRHPKKSGVKVIDFGSSCRSNRRMYSYIQSRFYRSPEVILGLKYTVAIDMWSLGCILAEMHTGEPLFSGSDQFDQMQKIVKLLGMVPDEILLKTSDQIKYQFFEKVRVPGGQDVWTIRQVKQGTAATAEDKPLVVPSTNPIMSLTDVITAGSRQKKKFPPSEAHNTQRNYELFVDLVYKMLAYEPSERIKPDEALNHPFIIAGDQGGVTAMQTSR